MSWEYIFNLYFYMVCKYEIFFWLSKVCIPYPWSLTYLLYILCISRASRRYYKLFLSNDLSWIWWIVHHIKNHSATHNNRSSTTVVLIAFPFAFWSFFGIRHQIWQETNVNCHMATSIVWYPLIYSIAISNIREFLKYSLFSILLSFNVQCLID